MIAHEDASLRTFVWSILQLLVNRDYAALERVSSANRLSASDMERAVSDYGRTLVMPSSEDFHPDIVPSTIKGPRNWSIVIPLFTAEEGPSDLSLDLLVREPESESFKLEIEDLHVR